MRVLRGLLALLILTVLGTAANAAEVAIPPSPAHWATDTAGFLKPQTVADLDARLRAYQAETGHQILVYVAPTTGTTPTEDWTVRAFARWKVGRKGLDDALILFVFPTDRKVRIEVGYGFEQTVPDATAARIIRDTITPKIRAGQPDEAVTAGVDEILAAVGGEASGKAGGAPSKVDAPAPVPRATPQWEPYPARDPGETFGEAIGILIGALIAVGIVFLLIKLARWLPDTGGTYVSSHDDGWGIAGMLLGSVVGSVTSGGFSGGGGMSG